MISDGRHLSGRLQEAIDKALATNLHSWRLVTGPNGANPMARQGV